MSLEISRMLTVSTAHLPPNFADLLSDPDCTVVCYEFEYGWLVWAGAESEQVETYPPGVLEAVRLARQYVCEWVKFDQDGPEVWGLPIFDWDTANATED